MISCREVRGGHSEGVRCTDLNHVSTVRRRELLGYWHGINCHLGASSGFARQKRRSSGSDVTKSIVRGNVARKGQEAMSSEDRSRGDVAGNHRKRRDAKEYRMRRVGRIGREAFDHRAVGGSTRKIAKPSQASGQTRSCLDCSYNAPALEDKPFKHCVIAWTNR